MSIADKLTSLINTKQDIKSAISEKGVEVTGGMTTYADAIRRIETGGGGGGLPPGPAILPQCGPHLPGGRRRPGPQGQRPGHHPGYHPGALPGV